MKVLSLPYKVCKKIGALAKLWQPFIVISFFTFSLLASPTVSWVSSSEDSSHVTLLSQHYYENIITPHTCDQQDFSTHTCQASNSPQEDEEPLPDEASFQFDTIDDLIETHFDLVAPTSAAADFANHPLFLATALSNLLRPPWQSV